MRSNHARDARILIRHSRSFLALATAPTQGMQNAVTEIIAAVRARGDAAVIEVPPTV